MVGSRKTIWLLLLILLTSPVWWPSVVQFLTPRMDFESSSSSSGSMSTIERFEMKGVSMIRYENGLKELAVEAARVHSTEVDGDLQMAEVDGIFYDDKGGQKARIKGDKGLYEQSKEILTLENRVSVELQNGWIMKSEALRYQIKSQKVKTSSDVVLQGKNMTVSGTGMMYDLKTGSFRVGGRVICISEN